MLHRCQNQTKAAKILRLRWDEAHEMQERAVEQGLSRREEKEIECLGIDEKSFLKGHLPNILTYLRHRITNAMAEGINSKIQQVKSAARGFRNFYKYRIAILFHCGKLNMYPHKSL